MSYKVCFMGASLETGNRGVSALAVSFIKNVLAIRPDAQISFLMANRVSKYLDINISDNMIRIQIINYRLSPKAKVREHLLWILLLSVLQHLIPFKFISDKLIRSNSFLYALKDADFVGNIHGGDSFSDIYGLSRFITSTFDDIIALLMKKKLVLLPQTYGPFNHSITRFIASFIVKKSYRLYSRDLQSIEVLRKMLGSKNGEIQITFCPDIAFTLDSAKMDLSKVEPPIGQRFDLSLIGVNVNGLMYNGGYNKQNMFGLKCDYKLFLTSLVKKFLDETNAHVLLIPHTFGPVGNINSDPDACRDLMVHLYGQFKDRIHISKHEYNQSEIKGLIGLCDFFIGSRMHACIAGLSQEIPTVCMAYSLKFQGIFDTVGVGEMVVDGRTLDAEAAVDRVFCCFQNREQIKVSLRGKVSLAKNQVITTFTQMLST